MLRACVARPCARARSPASSASIAVAVRAIAALRFWAAEHSRASGGASTEQPASSTTVATAAAVAAARAWATARPGASATEEPFDGLDRLGQVGPAEADPDVRIAEPERRRWQQEHARPLDERGGEPVCRATRRPAGQQPRKGDRAATGPDPGQRVALALEEPIQQ